MANVESALAAISETAHSMTLTAAGLNVPRGGHLQCAQVRRDRQRMREIVFLSHDSETTAYLVAAEFPPGLDGPGQVAGVHQFPSDGQLPPLRHAGGFQIAGDVLAIGLEDNQLKTRSEIQFWNIADAIKPTRLEHLTIRRRGEPKDQTAGAVALIEQKASHLVAVANWDSRAIDLYRCKGSRLEDASCRFEHLGRWRGDAADTADWQPDRRFGAYQAINFVADVRGRLYLLGFDTEPAGADVVDLYAVDIDKPPAQWFRKLVRKAIKLAEGNHFRFAAGANLLDGRLTVLASPRGLSPECTLSVSR